MNQIIKSRKEVKKVTMNDAVNSKIFLITDSFDTSPNKILRKTIQVNIIFMLFDQAIK
jgi:hypothetical protein